MSPFYFKMLIGTKVGNKIIKYSTFCKHFSGVKFVELDGTVKYELYYETLDEAIETICSYLDKYLNFLELDYSNLKCLEDSQVYSNKLKMWLNIQNLCSSNKLTVPELIVGGF